MKLCPRTFENQSDSLRCSEMHPSNKSFFEGSASSFNNFWYIIDAKKKAKWILALDPGRDERDEGGNRNHLNNKELR